MITLDDIKLEPTDQLVIAPIKVINDFCDILKNNGIPFKAYGRPDIKAGKIPNIELEKLNTLVEMSMQKYADAGYDDTLYPCAIISKVNPDDVFRKTCMMFGPNIDPDYKAKRERHERLSHQDYLRNHINDRGIPVRRA